VLLVASPVTATMATITAGSRGKRTTIGIAVGGRGKR
jgi:hypothetical protein